MCRAWRNFWHRVRERFLLYTVLPCLCSTQPINIRTFGWNRNQISFSRTSVTARGWSCITIRTFGSLFLCSLFFFSFFFCRSLSFALSRFSYCFSFSIIFFFVEFFFSIFVDYRVPHLHEINNFFVSKKIELLCSNKGKCITVTNAFQCSNANGESCKMR